MILYSKDTDNIVTLTLDMQGRADNILNHELVDRFVPVLDHLIAEKESGKLRGVVITSAKRTFLAGGDFEYLYRASDPKAIFEYAQKLKAFFRKLESPGVPVVAAINGSALSTGFELALACHRRIVVDDEGIELGFPEIHFGLMPGNGGVIRLMWLLGIEKAFEILLEGEKLSPSAAHSAGIVDELAVREQDLIPMAKQWLLQIREGRRPWDLPGSSIPGGTAHDPSMARKIAKLSASITARWKNNFPAPQAILNTLNEGSKVDFDTACCIESRNYTSLLVSPECKNMIKAMWFDLNAIHAGLSRPSGYGRFRPRKVGIIGAGTMGSGIAAACLAHGMEVVLKDASKMIAEKSRERIEHLLKKIFGSEKQLEKRVQKALAKLTTTEDSRAFSQCDIVIESVFESKPLKFKVTREAEEYLDDYAIIASNTVSIPISKLAENARRAQQYVGLHFFRPAESSKLVEIVRGNATSDETIARAFDFVLQIGKTPIIVKDDWGFYVSRVLNTYILEGVTMLQEGIPPAVIENAGMRAGMGIGPLQLADELSLELVLRYENQAAEHYGSKYVQHPAVAVLQYMLDEARRPGRQKGAGFYEWRSEVPVLWRGIEERFPSDASRVELFGQIIERLLFAQCIEAIWCLQEKVIGTVEEANVGSIYGWGFPAFKGGVMQCIYSFGLEQFITHCRALEGAHGQRFKVPRWLKRMAESIS